MGALRLDYGLRIKFAEYINLYNEIIASNDAISIKQIWNLKSRLSDLKYFLKRAFKTGEIDKDEYERLLEKYDNMLKEANSKFKENKHKKKNT